MRITLYDEVFFTCFETMLQPLSLSASLILINYMFFLVCVWLCFQMKHNFEDQFWEISRKITTMYFIVSVSGALCQYIQAFHASEA